MTCAGAVKRWSFAGVNKLSPVVAVCPEGANHQWRKVPPGQLSIGSEADERFRCVTGVKLARDDALHPARGRA